MFQSELVQVIPTSEFTVYLYFDDGSVRLYNAKQIIEKGGVFSKLSDVDVFMKTCTIMNDTLAWDVAGNYDICNCIDICPDTLLGCPLVEDVEAVEEKLFA
ncbi:MAG: DUF2442 domain-containing protein [Velocimicrobium sp.]